MTPSLSRSSKQTIVNKILFITTLLLYAKAVHAQTDTYYVIHVKGNITNTSTQKPILVGDVLKATDKISFNPKLSKAVLISTQKGRFTLGTPAKSAPSASGEFIAFLKNTLIPVKSVGNLSTRGHATEPCTSDLKKTIGSATFILPGDRAVLCLDRNAYPMNDNKFFIYRTHNGERETNYMIPFSEDSLIIEQSKFHGLQDESIDKKAELYYYDKLQNSSIRITSFIPVYVPADDLKKELSTLLQLYQKEKLSHDDVLAHLSQHLEEIYGGQTDAYMLERWLLSKGIKVR